LVLESAEAVDSLLAGDGSVLAEPEGFRLSLFEDLLYGRLLGLSQIEGLREAFDPIIKRRASVSRMSGVRGCGLGSWSGSLLFRLWRACGGTFICLSGQRTSPKSAE